MITQLHVDWVAIHTQAAQADKYNTPGGRALAQTCRELAAKRRRAAQRERARRQLAERAQEEPQ